MLPPVSGKRVILIGSLGFSLVNFRLDLMCRIVELGHEVIAVAPEFDAETVATLSGHGIRTRTVQMERTGTRPAMDLRTLIALVRIFREEAPDIVMPYTMKPIVYGSLAARIAGVRECYPLFTGLGYLFAGEPATRRRLLRSVSIALHRIGLRKVTTAFCYNDAEERDIRHFGLIPSTVSLVKIPGTGIDTKRFLPTPMPGAAPRFLFVGRLLRSKGLDMLATAVRQLRSQGHDVTVDLLGPEDSNPDAVDRATLEAWTKEGLFRHLGAVTDVRPVFAQSSIFVLPTTLREGVPRTILEAMACGLPVITTDAPGCGETITDGVSGWIVPQNDPAALGAAMLSFIEVPERAAEMGLAARAEVCRNNDVRRVNALLVKHMDLAAEVLPKPSVRAGIEAVA
ncbi:glycosyltransferase family 4 protein [Sulfitobacter sp. AS92]|uniref:glycosyltransferase family 4 protein n=1 Tax=Sulfitobacter sp. AS92 TaxID=3135783 RepID=UPI00316D98CD